ncbi:hypothetical protein [Streptomyces sp. CA-132043]
MPEPRTYRLRVTEVIDETADARSFVLRPPAGRRTGSPTGPGSS